MSGTAGIRDGSGRVAERGRAGRRAAAASRVPIGERVRQAHLDHFCPGGAGVPVTGSGPIGLGLPAAVPGGWDDHRARAPGQRCGRCRELIGPGEDARRRAGGGWVHEACPRLQSRADARSRPAVTR